MRSFPRAMVACGLVAGLAACSAEPAAAPRQPEAPAASASAAASESAPVQRLVATEVRGGNGQAPFDRPRTVQAPPGWTVSVWARVPGARLLAWAPDGRLLVSRPESGDVLALTSGGQETLVGGLNQPHGLAFDGTTLYVAESDQVDAFTYASGRVSGKRVVIDGLPDEKSAELGGKYAHALKTVVVGRDKALYISVGSTGNISAEDRDARPERAAILVKPAGGELRTFARGVRNGTGLAIAPNGDLWTAVNNRDNVPTQQGEVEEAYVNDHPLEPLARLTQGRDLGWPYCNPDPDLDAGALSYTRRPFLRDPDTNRDGSQLDCAKLPRIEQGMGAHSAPLGLSFVTDVPGGYGDGALAGIHGSWNRNPPRPPEVSFFAWRGGTLGPQQTLLTGFQLEDGSRWGRPVMAVQGPDDALYVSDDYAGAIYRIAAGPGR
ncbi:PQQ-dependent sugar dehydrogenase [Actinoplanes sp. URMC 104]|uniref:PQQ-dependent sugar dehydrogenase n=1 Tax=Actinoplanes sp. URMC 104 TaxID=3423409 RepID=UPI003F1C19F4